MKERPILMSGPMVRAILEGRKTQTRRVIAYPRSTGAFVCVQGFWTGSDRWWPLVSVDGESTDDGTGCETPIFCPYGISGDRLWVRERWTGTWTDASVHLVYAADGSERMAGEAPTEYVLPKAAAKVNGWVTPLFMPRWASRILLEVTDVRVQRLQEISEEDAREEGVSASELIQMSNGDPCYSSTFIKLWTNLHGIDNSSSWESNPWVWAITFKRIETSN